MSLTEREKEIALEVWEYYEYTTYPIDVMFEDFLSRIREEQEAIATVIVQNDFVSLSASVYMLSKLRDMNGMPLFTIPPAAPYNCNELVEASIKIKDYLESSACMIVGFDIPDDIYVPFCKSIANHAKRTKAGE